MHYLLFFPYATYKTPFPAIDSLNLREVFYHKIMLLEKHQNSGNSINSTPFSFVTPAYSLSENRPTEQ